MKLAALKKICNTSAQKKRFNAFASVANLNNVHVSQAGVAKILHGGTRKRKTEGHTQNFVKRKKGPNRSGCAGIEVKEYKITLLIDFFKNCYPKPALKGLL